MVEPGHSTELPQETVLPLPQQHPCFPCGTVRTESAMKYYFCVAALGIIALAFGQSPAFAVQDDSRVRVIGGIPSATTPTGPVVNGLALSLSDRQFPIRNRKGYTGYTWLALELRNVGTQLRWILWFSSLSNVRAVVTDQHGHVLSPYTYTKVDFDAPVSTNGAPLPPGKSIWLAIPIDAMVPLSRPGTYVVRIETGATTDARSKNLLRLISNPLTIRL